MLRKPIIAMLGMLSLASVQAKDLGVQGNVWPIVEIDMRQLVAESASRADWGKVREEMTSSAKNYLDRIPGRILPAASETKTTWFDPSVVLTSDIQAPVESPDGTYSWKVLFPKGTKVNPLKTHRPLTAFLFFDGSKEDQVALVKAVLAKEPLRVVPVEAGMGKIKQTNETLKRPVFHANDAMINRFHVTNLPTLVYPGSGAQSLYLGITQFGPPLDPLQVLKLWPAPKPADTPISIHGSARK